MQIPISLQKVANHLECGLDGFVLGLVPVEAWGDPIARFQPNQITVATTRDNWVSPKFGLFPRSGVLHPTIAVRQKQSIHTVNGLDFSMLLQFNLARVGIAKQNALSTTAALNPQNQTIRPCHHVCVIPFAKLFQSFFLVDRFTVKGAPDTKFPAFLGRLLKPRWEF